MKKNTENEYVEQCLLEMQTEKNIISGFRSVDLEAEKLIRFSK
jgi:hypothetical protein